MKKRCAYFLNLFLSITACAQESVCIGAKINTFIINDGLNVHIYPSDPRLPASIVPVIESDRKNIFYDYEEETGLVSLRSSQKQSWKSFFTREDKTIALNIYLPEPIYGIYVRDKSSVNLASQVVDPEYFHLKAEDTATINFNGYARRLDVIAESKSKVHLQGVVDRLVVSAWGQSVVSAEFGFAHAAHLMAYDNATVKAQGIASIQGECADKATVITSVPLQGQINIW